MDSCDSCTIQHIQKIIDDTIRERNETRQANKNIKKKEEQMKIHLDNLYVSWKAQSAKLIQYEETNNKIAIEILNLKQTIRQQMVCLTEINNQIKLFGDVEGQCEELLNETATQKDTLKEVELENEKIKDCIESYECSKRNLCEQVATKMEAMKSEINDLKEEYKILKKQLQSMCNDEFNIKTMYNRVKQDFEHTCNTLCCLENKVTKYKEIEKGLEDELKELLLLKEKLTTKELVDEKSVGDSEIKEDKNTEVVEKCRPTEQDREEISENKVHFEDYQCSSSKRQSPVSKRQSPANYTVSMCETPVSILRNADSFKTSRSTLATPPCSSNMPNFRQKRRLKLRQCKIQ